MADEFRRCLEITLRFERDAGDGKINFDIVGGATTNHPQDPGGLTSDGITKRDFDWLRDRRGHPRRSVALMTAEERNAIYKIRYWNACHCARMAWPLNLIVFDYAVNSGAAQAAKDLQRVLGVAADGALGPKTLAALGFAQAGEGAASLAAGVQERRRAMLRAAVSRNPSLGVFAVGWERRVRALDGEIVGGG